MEKHLFVFLFTKFKAKKQNVTIRTKKKKVNQKCYLLSRSHSRPRCLRSLLLCFHFVVVLTISVVMAIVIAIVDAIFVIVVIVLTE